MSATERLRELLDEREVEWHDTKIGKGFITVYEHDGITWIVTEHSSGRLSVKGYVKPTQGHYDGMTPEQAIAATLGPGTCKLTQASWDDGTCTWGCICSACDAHLEHETGIGYNYCPICGAKVVAE